MARPREFDEDDVVRRATAVFWAKGYQRTTPQDLLEATGLSKSSLYATFGNKEGLFLRALDFYIDAQINAVRQLLTGPSFRDALTAVFERIVKMSTPDEKGCLICTATVECTSADEAVRSRVDGARKRLLRMLTKRIELAQHEGEVPDARSASGLALLAVSNNMGLTVLARGGASKRQLRVAAREVVASICD